MVHTHILLLILITGAITFFSRIAVFLFRIKFSENHQRIMEYLPLCVMTLLIFPTLIGEIISLIN
ncbi:MAG: AzlD domain-containing protein [Bifidobacteriaceae bacterium]|nr:AzlD domain-containing protein [Bifidobacteriaceae bacterium]